MTQCARCAEQVGAQHAARAGCSTCASEVSRGQQGGPLAPASAAPLTSATTLSASGPGEQHPALLEHLAHRGDDQLAGASPRRSPAGRPLRRRRPGPRQVRVGVAGVDPAAGEDHHPRRERHRGDPAQHEHLDRAAVAAAPSRTNITVAAGFGATGLGPGAVEPGAGARVGETADREVPGHVRARGRSVSPRRSTTISTSTGASSGSTATPTAERACMPASPKALPSSSEAPLTTPGWPVKDGSLTPRSRRP